MLLSAILSLAWLARCAMLVSLIGARCGRPMGRVALSKGPEQRPLLRMFVLLDRYSIDWERLVPLVHTAHF